MEKQIKLFLEFLENDKKLSNNTLQSYKRDIVQYQEYIDKNGLNYLKIDHEDIDRYFENLKQMNKNEVFGWDANYRDDNRLVLFSGDVTSAPYPNGATEAFFVNKT